MYDFGLPSERLIVERPWSRMAVEVKSPAWFDLLNIDYRLLYDDPRALREYSGSRWAGGRWCSSLIAQRLRQQLGLVGLTGAAAADCLLRVELHEFSQVFDSATVSRGVLQARVAIDDQRRQIVAEHTVLIEKPASSADALSETVNELSRRTADWLGQLQREGRLGTCRQV